MGADVLSSRNGILMGARRAGALPTHRAAFTYWFCFWFSDFALAYRVKVIYLINLFTELLMNLIWAAALITLRDPHTGKCPTLATASCLCH